MGGEAWTRWSLLQLLALSVGCGEAPPEVSIDTTFSDCAANEQFSAGAVQQVADGRLADMAASAVAFSTPDPRTQTFGNGTLTTTLRQAVLLRLLRTQFPVRPALSNGKSGLPI